MNNVKLITTRPAAEMFNIVTFPRGYFGVMVQRPDPIIPDHISEFTNNDPQALVFRTLSGDLIRLFDGDRWPIGEIENYQLGLADRFQIRKLYENEVIQIGFTQSK